MSIANIENVRKNWDTWVKVGLIALVALVVSPIIFMVIQGIVGLAVASVLGLVVVNLAPVVSMKVANWKVKGIVAEAKENPIETMVNLLSAKKKAYSEFRVSVENAVTAREDFAIKCRNFSKQYPERAEEFTKQLDNMTKLVEQKKRALSEAKEMLEAGDLKLKEMRAYWDMSMAAQAANKATGMDTGDMYDQLKADTAVDAVFESMNRAFAQLEVASMLESLPNEQSVFSNQITQVTVKEKI